MAAIDSDLQRELIKALRANSTIQNKIAKDSKNNLAIHPGKFVPTSAVFPLITLDISDDSSEQVFPATRVTANITIWLDAKTKEQSYSFLTTVKDAIIALFNREGGAFSNIDVSTDTGVRVCNLLKRSVIYDYDEVIQKHYCEIIFDIVRSESESFAAVDAGNKAWI